MRFGNADNSSRHPEKPRAAASRLKRRMEQLGAIISLRLCKHYPCIDPLHTNNTFGIIAGRPCAQKSKPAAFVLPP